MNNESGIKETCLFCEFILGCRKLRSYLIKNITKEEVYLNEEKA